MGKPKKKNSLKEAPYGTRTWWDGRVWQESPALREYAGGYEKDLEWKPNEPFTATLSIVSLERGRSAARFWFEHSETGVLYPVFGQGLVEILAKSNVYAGEVSGTWIVVKKGQNYGIELYEEEN